jgi:putative transposase
VTWVCETDGTEPKRNLMPFTYSPQYRAMVINQVHDGKPVAVIAEELGLNQSTVFRWKKQDRVDQGLDPGTPSHQSGELREARRRIGELETELAATKRAATLFDEGRVVRPKDLYPIIETMGTEGHSLKACCRLLNVASSGFFVWRTKPPSARSIRRAWLRDVITEIWERSRRTYGWRRVQAELDDMYNQRVNHKLVRAVMRELGIGGLPKRRKGRPNIKHIATCEDFVNRDFSRDGPNQLWMSDITEHPTREGRVFCCVVLDAWSRRIVGWSIDARPTAAMVNSALAMAINARKPSLGMVVHADHGPQYTSWAFSSHIRSAGLVQSLGTVGDAYDNAMVESLWGRMQTELLNTKTWSTRLELSTAMFDWIEGFYNRTRRHSALGNISPMEFERRHRQLKSVA